MILNLICISSIWFQVKKFDVTKYIKCWINISDNLLNVQGTVSRVLKSSLTIICTQVKSWVLYISALKNMQIMSYRKFDHSTQIFGEKRSWITVELEKNVVFMDKPIYLRFKILERSKYRVYDFFYNVVKANLKNTELILTDTDSLLVKFESKDYVEDLKKSNMSLTSSRCQPVTH